MAPADLRRQNKHTHIFDRGGSPTRPLACRVREPAVRCAAVQLMENNKTHTQGFKLQASERERERNGVFKLLHILFREKRKQEENNFFKIVLLERRKEEQISMNSRKKKPTRETCWARERSERETRNAVWIECTSRFSSV